MKLKYMYVHWQRHDLVTRPSFVQVFPHHPKHQLTVQLYSMVDDPHKFNSESHTHKLTAVSTTLTLSHTHTYTDYTHADHHSKRTEYRKSEYRRPTKPPAKPKHQAIQKHAREYMYVAAGIRQVSANNAVSLLFGLTS